VRSRATDLYAMPIGGRGENRTPVGTLHERYYDTKRKGGTSRRGICPLLDVKKVRLKLYTEEDISTKGLSREKGPGGGEEKENASFRLKEADPSMRGRTGSGREKGA